MAIIDFNTFERLRAQGISDSTIADQMASSNKTFASHYDKIKKQTNNDPRAISSYLNYRFYGDANHTAPEPEKQKGYFGRTLDRMMKDAGDVRGALDSYNAGEQGAVNTTAQVAGNLFSGVLSPATEAVGTAVNKGLEITGLDDRIASGVQTFTGSEFGQGLINSAPVQGTANYLQNNPTGKSIAAVGEAALDAGDVLGVGALGKAGLTQAGKAGLTKGVALNAIQHPIKTTGQVAGAAANATGQAFNLAGRGVRAGFDNTAGAMFRGIRGAADNVVGGLDDVTEEVLTGVGKKAVKSGVDEKVVRFAGKLTPETKAIAQAMTKEADKGSKLLEGTVVHKELLGQQILSPLRHSLGIKQEVGKRLGAMKKARYGEPVDITEEFGTLQTKLAELGVEVGEKGKIASMGALADANKPILQKLVDFFGDADGPVIKDFEKIDQFRSRMFEELRSAKSKLANPSEAGAVFSQAEKLVDQFRRSLFIKAAGGDPSLIRLNDMYGEISSATKRFVQKSGIAQLNESKLNFDDITLKDLKAAEFSKRALGNASSNALSEIKAITDLSKKLGFQSNVDVESLIHYTKALDNMYGITKAGSLQGEVQSAVQGAAGGVVNDLVRGVGPVRAGANVIGDQLINAFNKMTGITPERRTKLLLDLLDSDPEANLIETIRKAAGSKFADKVDDLVPDSAKVKEVKPAVIDELEEVIPDGASLNSNEIFRASDDISKDAVQSFKDDIANKKQSDADSLKQYIQEIDLEIQNKQSEIDALPNLSRAIDRKTGRLYEAGDPRSKISIDDVADELGFSDSEQLRDAYDRVINNKKEIKSLRKSKSEGKAELRSLLKKKTNFKEELTPEERATGLTGGGGDNMPRKSQSVSNNVSGKIDNVDTNLLKEAKKYKSAEEFVEAQSMRRYLESEGIKVNDDNTVTLWHAAPSEDIKKKIIKEGFFKGGATAPGGMTGLQLDKSAFFGSDKDWVKNTWGGGQGHLIEVKVPVEQYRHGAQNPIEAYFEGGLRKGSDGIWRAEKLRDTFVNQIAVIDFGDDLTDIYNQAVGN